MSRRFLSPFALALTLLLVLPASLFARGGGGCIEQGTLIDTPAGPVAVERLAPGDHVTGLHGQAVVQACMRVQPAEFVEIAAAGLTLRLTAEHPLMVAPGVFLRADAIQAGQQLRLGNDAATVASVRRVQTGRAAYNLLVSPGGVYFANGIAVHNKGCFLPDTPVLRADGLPVAIRDVRVGDELKAFEPDGAIVAAKVRAVLTAEVERYAVVTTAGRVLRVTPDHPFYVGSGRFQTLESLRVGDRVFAFDGAALSPQPITAIEIVAGHVTVYNLQTDRPHTFFADGIAVHNKGGGGCFPAGTAVRTPSGAVAIETLKPGDAIAAINAAGELVESRVRATHRTASPLLTLTTTLGRLRTTEEHPLRMASGQFRLAGELVVGDEISCWHAGRLAAARITARELGAEAVPVFNLEADAPHTFFADDFVVHNKGGGGGGGFRSSGGSYHSYGGSRSGSSTSQPAFFDSWCCSTPVVILFIFVLFILKAAIFGSSTSKKDADLDFCHSRSAIARKGNKTVKLIEFIARQDSAMQPGTLVGVATGTFLKLQQCWQARDDYSPMQPLMMPDLYRDHLNQLAGLRKDHEFDIIEGLEVKAVDLVNVRYTEKPDEREFTALITARARDYYVDDRNPSQKIRGDDAPATFQEFWTFQRQGDAWLLREVEQTRESDKLKEENFFEQFTDKGLGEVYGETKSAGGPSGTWLEADVSAKVDKITRMLNFLVRTDTMWDRQAMLTRIRQVFLDVMLAQERGDPAAVPADALFPDIAESLRAELARRQGAGVTVEYRNLCVRKVELVLIRNMARNGEDELTTRISAHAQKIIHKAGDVIHADEFVTPFEDYWVFSRLDGQWKLKELLPPAGGKKRVAAENVDAETSPEMVQWYYKHTRSTL
ncbi:MAG: polymorphic toxin-type HINT domain-containing protein [Phycisphaerae bacterium]|nr:polymorphic toxin-type HINT domain-containing protein [Phycisphaerae bacterium]